VTGLSPRGWRLKLVLVALGAACLLAIALPVVANENGDTPTWKLKS
jgi:hypothetical protein